MRFGRTLRKTVYPPWEGQYIDYDKLKQLLREGNSDAGEADDENDAWTDEDEDKFVDELVNTQLEKINAFQNKTYSDLKDRTQKCEEKLDPLVQQIKKNEGVEQEGGSAPSGGLSESFKEGVLKEVLGELDDITKEVNELERYSRINYTGFLKIAKKHDRKRGQSYRVRPFLQVRLADLDFNKAEYSPLLYRLSAMYSFVRQNLDAKTERPSFSDAMPGGEGYISHKFWVHPENLLEVKTVILRRLPVLIYNPQTSKIAEGSQKDPGITSIYFDNPRFDLYGKKVAHEPDASSLRLRWYGQLADKDPEDAEVYIEKKVIKEGDVSEEHRFQIPEKSILPFLKGEYKMDEEIKDLEERGQNDKASEMKQNVADIQKFVKEGELAPVVRANYTRTAFQIPGDDNIRISLDTNLALIREDSLDPDRPCREPDDWHRPDIDNNQFEYPFNSIRKGEINRFPFALLEIKIKNRRKYEWVEDLMHSHLVKEAPQFSKFVHGVATLFEDYVNSFPFWMSDVDTDIRKDPHKAFEEEQDRRQRAAEDESAVGSFLGSRSPAFQPGVKSPAAPAPMERNLKPGNGKAPDRKSSLANMTAVVPSKDKDEENVVEEEDDDDDGPQADRSAPSGLQGFKSLFPSFSTSKYARRHEARGGKLPPGVVEPKTWIKDEGEVKVEAKVWLANQRTFIKWQHVAVLLASLSLGLYNAAGQDNNVARSLAVVYTIIAVFTGIWGWAMYMYRAHLIYRRSGKEMDNTVGPVIVCLGLIVALCLNFAFKVSPDVVCIRVTTY